MRVSWQRFDGSHSQLGRFSNIRESGILQACSLLLFTRGGWLLMLFLLLLLRMQLLLLLLCLHWLPHHTQTSHSILASVLPLDHFGHIWSVLSPASLYPEKSQSLDFNSLWILRTPEPPSQLSDALSCSTCFTWIVERMAGVASGPDSLNHYSYTECFFFLTAT